MIKPLLLAAAMSAAALTAQAADPVVAGVKVVHAWSRPAPKGGVGVGYVSLTNVGKGPVTVVSIASAGAAASSLHRTTQTNGVYSMGPAGGLVIPEGRQVAIEPGGYHIMFQGLKTALRPGDVLKAEITVRRGSRTQTVPVDFKVEGPKS